MARTPLPKEFMPVAELALKMGMDIVRVCDTMRLDSKRSLKKWPFAEAWHNEKTDTWQYRIHRGRFAAWERGELVDPGGLAAIVAEKVAESIRAG